MTRYTSNSSVQPAIPQGNGERIEWESLNAEQRNWITKATEVRLGKPFPGKVRDKILYGSWFQLSERVKNQIYASDWKAVLRRIKA